MEVPEFAFLGQSDVKLETVVDNDGILSFLPPDIGVVESTTEVLNSDAKYKYLDAGTRNSGWAADPRHGKGLSSENWLFNEEPQGYRGATSNPGSSSSRQ